MHCWFMSNQAAYLLRHICYYNSTGWFREHFGDLFCRYLRCSFTLYLVLEWVIQSQNFTCWYLLNWYLDGHGFHQKFVPLYAKCFCVCVLCFSVLLFLSFSPFFYPCLFSFLFCSFKYLKITRITCIGLLTIL